MLIAPTYDFQGIKHQRDLTTTFLPFILVSIHWEALTHPSATTFAPRQPQFHVHRIRGTNGIFTYIYHKKSTIHVGKCTIVTWFLFFVDGFFFGQFSKQLLNGVFLVPFKKVGSVPYNPPIGSIYQTYIPCRPWMIICHRSHPFFREPGNSN